MTEPTLCGKVALVTGGTRGIGRAIAHGLASAGASVWTTSRQADSPTPEFEVEAGQVGTVGMDVTDADSIRRVFEAMDAAHGRIDVLINNAGVGVFGDIETLDEHDVRVMLETNVVGAFLCSQAAYVRMKRQGGGRIINIGSIAGVTPIPGNTAYGASKYALRGLSLTLNEEAKAFGVRVTQLNLGAVYTEIWHGRDGFDPSDMLPMEEVASTCVQIAGRPLNVRVDEVTLVPPKGVL